MNVLVEPIDNCAMCGSTPQTHIDFPQGIKMVIPGQVKFEMSEFQDDVVPEVLLHDTIVCHEYMTRYGVTLSRTYLMMMLGDV